MFFLAKKLFAGSVKQFGVLHYFHLKCHCEKYPREKLSDIKLWIPTLRVFVNFDEIALFFISHADNKHTGWRKLAGFRRTQINAVNFFVGGVFANLQQKTLFLLVLPNHNKIRSFWAYKQIHGNIVFDIKAF